LSWPKEIILSVTRRPRWPKQVFTCRWRYCQQMLPM
jgi:hypothetical protein